MTTAFTEGLHVIEKVMKLEDGDHEREHWRVLMSASGRMALRYAVQRFRNTSFTVKGQSQLTALLSD